MMDTHTKLINALTEWDRRNAKRKGYNPYALPQYFQAVAAAEEDISTGVSLRQALVNHFCGRGLDVCLKAVGLPASTRQEQMG